MTDEQSKEFIRRVLADYEKTENMSASYRAVKATYSEGTEFPTYSGCVKAYERKQKAAAKALKEQATESAIKHVDNVLGMTEEEPAEERTGTVQKIRMLNNLIESLTAEDWAEEQAMLKEIREDYLAALENAK